MKNILLVGLVVAVVGCGPNLSERCVIEGLENVSADEPIDCDAFQFNYDLAIEGFVMNKLYESPQQAKDVYKTLYVHVRNDANWRYMGKTVIGTYNAVTHRATVDRNTASLAHELLHVRDQHYFKFWTPLHIGWKNGPYGMADWGHYRHKFIPVMGDYDGVIRLTADEDCAEENVEL